MNIIPNFYPKCYLNSKDYQKNCINSLSFGRVIDYYEPEEIKEASENYGIFRKHGEDNFSYYKRARETHDAWERQEQLRAESDKKPWWKIF